jgi:hypothetical protein
MELARPLISLEESTQVFPADNFIRRTFVTQFDNSRGWPQVATAASYFTRSMM